MKKLLLILFIPWLAQAQSFGSFVVENTNFKQLFNKYRVASPDKIPWVGSWWAFKRNGTTYNGMYGKNSNEQGPTQKFESFYGLGDAATKWEAANNTCDKLKKDDQIESCKGWWGHCNAWAGAAIKEVEPREEFLGENDIGEKMVFTIADQKAYLTEIYMETNSSFVGKRNNQEKGDWIFDKDHKTSKALKNPKYPYLGTKYEAFWDVTPKQFLLVFTNYIGIRRIGIVIDRYTGSQVWNQPIAGYRILPILNEHIKEPEVRDGKTVFPVLVRMKMYWAEDGVGELEISKSFDINRTNDEFKYKEHYNKHYSGRSLAFYLFFDQELKVSKDGKKIKTAGKIIGDGIWFHQTEEGAKDWKGVIENTHPDFMWLPNELISKKRGRSRPPVLTEERVRDLFADKKEIKEQRENLEKRVDNLNSLAKFKKLQKDVLSFREKGFISERAMVEILINLKRNSIIFVDNPTDFIRLVKTGMKKPSNKYKLGISKFIAENIDFFFSLNPNTTSLLSLQKEILGNSTKGSNSIRTVLSLKDKGLARTEKSNSFLKTLGLGTEKSSKYYKKAMAAFLTTKIKDFMVLSPTVNEVLSFQSLLFETGAGFQAAYSLKELAIKSAARYQDYVALLDLGTTKSPKAYRKLVFNLAKENPFKNPDTEGILRVGDDITFATFIKNHQIIVRRMNYSYNDIINHKKDGLKLISRPEEMSELVAPRLNSVSVRYQRLIDNFISQNLSEMIEKVHPDLSSLMRLHKFVLDIDTDMDIKNAALRVLSGVDDLFKLLDPGKLDVSESYREAISDFMTKNISLLRERCSPSLKRWLGLTRYAESVKGFMAVKEEGIVLIKGPEDLKLLLGSETVGNPSDDLKDAQDSFLQKNIAKMIGYADPSSEQIVALTTYTTTLGGKMAIKEAGRGRVKTLEDFAYILDPYVKSPSKKYLRAIDKFKESNPFKDEDGNIVEMSYVNCSYFLKTKVIKWKKEQFLGAAYDKGLACNKALEKCMVRKKWNTKCFREK